METTLCWKCNGAYEIAKPVCPHCKATNANVDPDKAIAEMEAPASPKTA